MVLLGQQLRNYENIFTQLAPQMTEVINNLQREANREFTPVIARNLSSAYDWCANESGKNSTNLMPDDSNTSIRSWPIHENEEPYGYTC